MVLVQSRRALSLLEKRANVFHELIVVEKYADRGLELVQVILLEENVGPALGRDFCLLGEREHLNGFDHESAGEVTADETDHLEVVEAGYRMIVGRAVKDLPNLLQKALSVELGSAHEGVLAEGNMVALEGGVETSGQMMALTIQLKRLSAFPLCGPG